MVQVSSQHRAPLAFVALAGDQVLRRLAEVLEEPFGERVLFVTGAQFGHEGWQVCEILAGEPRGGDTPAFFYVGAAGFKNPIQR